MALRTEQKLPIILFVVFLVLTTVGFLFYQSNASFQEALEWQRKANESTARVDEVARLAMNVDSSVFGFVYTGNDTYLDGFNRARTRIPENIARLKQLAADSEEETAQVAQLEAAVNEVLLEAERKIEARKIGGRDVREEQIVNIADRPRMDLVQLSVRQIKETVRTRFQAQDTGFDQGLARSVWILIGSSITGILALALANYVVFREIRKRQFAETELIETNRDLEEKVDERTEELTVMNERLLDIGSERELLLKGEKRARQEAEVANRLRDEFMATVSHELRTPLNSILGWARLLKDGTLDHSQSEKAVATIIKNSETQNRLIEDLLDVARLISGKLELAKDEIAIVDVISDSIETARPAAQAKHIRIDFNQAGIGDGCIVLGDGGRLRQVFSNLLTNAIKFSFDGGNIFVRTFADDGECVTEVIDEGVGISGEFLPLVFERFRQDVNSPGRNGGLGLGLAIVRNLVEMHGGSVSVESDGQNKGSKFTVRLPLA